MKAARLHTPGQPLAIEQCPAPTLRPSGVRVRVLASAVPAFGQGVLSGRLPIPLPVPYIPGPSCVGTVEDVADDVVGLTRGDVVFCSPTYVQEVHGGARESILIGWFGLTPGCAPLLERWKNGAWAEQAVYPAECVTPLGKGAGADDIRLGPLAIAYGGLLRAELRPGQSVLINGATGNLGSAAVLVALALGASRVVARGRNAAVLDELSALDRRVVVRETNSDEAVEPVDAVLDVLGYVTEAEPVTSGLAALRPGGTAVFMGGVLADIPVAYLTMLVSQWTLRGAFMYPAEAPAELVRMMSAGTLNASAIRTTVHPLDQINEALAAAPGLRGPRMCYVVP